MEDSIYNYCTDSLLTKRAEVDVREDAPTLSRKKGRGRRTATRGKTVTVRSGQTLSEIARRNGTTVAKLKRLNGIKGTNIRAGKKLRVR